MTVKRCLVLTWCVSVAGLLLAGCSESPVTDPPESPGPLLHANNQPPKVEEPPVVTLTAQAAATVNQLIADQGGTGTCVLRVRVVPGGCQGFMHKLDLDSHTSTEDHLCESRGIKVALFKRQVDMLRGAEIDFGHVDGQQGFKIENPNFKGESAKKWLACLEKEKDAK